MATINETIQFAVDATPAEQGASKLTESLKRIETAERSAQASTATFEQQVAKLGRSQEFSAIGLRKLSTAFGAQVGATKQAVAAIRDVGAAVASVESALGRYSAAVASGASRTKDLEGASRRTQASLAATVAGVGRIAALFGAGLGIRTGVTAVASFERAIAQVGVISRSTADELEDIRKQSAALGATTEKTATQAAEGALFLARAGFDAQKILGALPGTLQLSVAGALDLGEAADIASNALAQFQLSASETNRVTNALLVTASSSNTDVRSLAEALKFAGSVAGSVNRDIEETAAAIGVLGDRGIQGSLAGRALRGIFLDLTSPTREARSELNRFGADLSKLDPRLNSIADIADELGKSFRAGADAGRIFGAEQAAQALILGQSSGRIRELIQAQREWRTATDDVASAISDTLSGSLKAFESAIEGVFIQAGEDGLSGALRNVVDISTETVRKLGGLEKEVGKFGTTSTVAASAIEVLGVALALSGGVKFIAFIGSAVTLIPRLVGGVLGATAAVKGLNAALLLNPWTAVGVAATAAVVGLRAYSRQIEEVARSQDSVRTSAEEFRARIEAIQKTLERGRGAATIGPVTEEDSIRRQIKQIEALRQAVVDAQAAFSGDRLPARQEFANVEQFRAQTEKVRADLKELEALQQRIANFGSRGRDGLFEGEISAKPLAQVRAEIESLTVLRDNLTQQPIRIADILLVPSDFRGIRELFDSAGLADDLKKLEASARSITGIDRPFIDAGQAIDLLRGKVPELNATFEQLKTAYENATAGQRDYSLAIRAGIGTIAEESQALEERRRLLAQAEAGVLTLAQAESIANRERDIRRRTLEAIKVAEQVNGRLSEEAAKAIGTQVRALVEGQAAADQWADRIKSAGRASIAAADDAAQLVASLEQQAEAIRAISSPADTLDGILERLGETLGRDSDLFATFAERAKQAFQTIEQARAAEARAAQDDRALRLQEQRLERFAEIERGILNERAALLLTRDATRSLALAEEARAAGLDEQSQQRIRSLAQEINTLERLRELSDGLASGVGDALRALKDGATGREALQAFAQGAGDQIFESSLSRLQEQISSSITSALGSLFGAPAVGPGITPGDTAIVTAVDQVRAAILSTAAAGTGGGNGTTPTPAGFNFGGFLSSLGTGLFGFALSRLGQGRGGTREEGGAGFTPRSTASGGSTSARTFQTVTINNYVSPDAKRLTPRQIAAGRDAIWKR